MMDEFSIRFKKSKKILFLSRNVPLFICFRMFYNIKEKLLSSLIFVNPYGEAENLGTDLYNEKLEKTKTVPYKHNYGYFFTSGARTWHGMEKKEIKKERRCLQINYVTFKTDWQVN